MFGSVVDPNSEGLSREQFSQAVMLLNARMVPIIPQELACCGCRSWRQRSVTLARRRVLRFLCRSSIIFNTEIVWFEVGMCAVVAVSMVINVAAVYRFDRTDVIYDDKLQDLHYVTLPCFVLEVRGRVPESKLKPLTPKGVAFAWACFAVVVGVAPPLCSGCVVSPRCRGVC